MQRRIRRVTRQIRRAGGVDLVLTHAPAAGLGDDTDLAHRGFEAFLPLLDRWHPSVMVHGHVHRSYRPSVPRVLQYGETHIINASGKYYLDL
jgi:Icc-related predicted phosphoesterase